MKARLWLAVAGTVVPAILGTGAGAQGTSSRPAVAIDALSNSMVQIAERVMPGVVQIFVSSYGVAPDLPNVLTKEKGAASGVVIDPGGYIVTNAHVIAGARLIQVLLADGAPAGTGQPAVPRPRGAKLVAQVVGIDAATDLALLKIPARNLPALTLGDSDRLRQGQIVLAFGSPLGLDNTVTMGVVSAVARQVKADDPLDYVQTDAPINPGNSGGPLVDSNGDMIGLNTMLISQSGGSEGMGLAIPSNTVRDIADQLRARGRVRRGVISVQVQDVTPTMAAALGLPQAWGVIIADLKPGGPAEKAGLKVGDVILSTDGKPIANVREFGNNLYRHAIDVAVTLEVRRGSDKLSVRVPVIERGDDSGRFLEMVTPEKNLVPQLDILGVDIDRKLAGLLKDLRLEGGVLVAAMSSDAAPPATRFHPGDVIHAVNHSPVQSLADLRAAVAGLHDGDPVVVQIEREGRLQFIAFEAD